MTNKQPTNTATPVSERQTNEKHVDDAQIEDLDPAKTDDEVRGGDGLTYGQVQWTYTPQKAD